jgi:hypothetical protein
MFTPSPPRAKIVSGYITEQEYDELAAVAERYGLTLSTAVQQCIIAGLEAERQAEEQDPITQPTNGSLRKISRRGSRRATA